MKHNNVQEYVQLKTSLTSEKARIEERLQQIRQALGEGPAGIQPQNDAPDRTRRPSYSKGQNRVPNAGISTPIGKPSGYGSLKNSIIAELQSAGEKGIHIDDLARAVGNKVANVRVWFYSSAARQLRNIAKVGRGRYGWRG